MPATIFDISTKRPATILKSRDGVQLVEVLGSAMQCTVLSKADKADFGGLLVHKLINTFSNGVQVFVKGLLNDDGSPTDLTLTLPAWDSLDFGGVLFPPGTTITPAVAHVVMVIWSKVDCE